MLPSLLSTGKVPENCGLEPHEVEYFETQAFGFSTFFGGQMAYTGVPIRAKFGDKDVVIGVMCTGWVGTQADKPPGFDDLVWECSRKLSQAYLALA